MGDRRTQLPVAIIAAIATIGVAVINNWQDLFGSSRESRSGPKLTITNPRAGAIVNRVETVSGTYDGISSDKRAWVIVYSYPAEKYFPSRSASVFTSRTWWEAANVSIGAAADVGKSFDLLAVVVDQAGRQALEGYLSQADSAGMQELPTGVTTYDRRRVITRLRAGGSSQ